MYECKKCGRMYSGVGKLCPACEAEVAKKLAKGRKLFTRYGLESFNMKYDIDTGHYECTNPDGTWVSYDGKNWKQTVCAKPLSVKYKPNPALETDTKEVELHGFPLDMAEGFVKNDSGKLQWSLLPFAEVEEVVRVLMKGAKKYTPDNWKKCDDTKRYEDALMRHVIAYIKGDKIDEVSQGGDGLSHLAHAVCNCLFLMYFDNTKKEK